MNKKIHFLYILGWIALSFFFLQGLDGRQDFDSYLGLLGVIFFIILHYLLFKNAPKTKTIFMFSCYSFIYLTFNLYGFLFNNDTDFFVSNHEAQMILVFFFSPPYIILGIISLIQVLQYRKTYKMQLQKEANESNLFIFKFIHFFCMAGWVALSFFFLFDWQIALLGSIFGIIVHYLLWKDAPRSNSIFVFSLFSFIYLLFNFYGFLMIEAEYRYLLIRLIIFLLAPYILLGTTPLIQVLKYRKELKPQSTN